MKLFQLVSVFGVSALLFTACDPGASSSENDPFRSQESDKDQIYLNTYPEALKIKDATQRELYTNYSMLDLFYLYGHMRNEISDDYHVYLGKGTVSDNEVKGFCTEDYYDLCYMYNQMADPFTQYFDPNIAQMVLQSVMETEEIVGVGANVGIVSDGVSSNLVVTDVYSGSPSEKGGLKVGDIVLAVDGLPITTPESFERMCTGEMGATVQITVRRGEETLVVSVVLGEFHAPSVKVHYEDSIPVIEILEFSGTTSHERGTYGEFLEALKKTEGAKSTIIDLRRNPGGDTDHCDSVSYEMLSAGDTVITDIMTEIDLVRDGDGFKYVPIQVDSTHKALRDGIGKDRYYVLMSSDTSASCAEIVLSSISVNKKAPIVGVKSYGKGIGQRVVTGKIFEGVFVNGLALITGLQGVDKNGDSYHDLGIVPDFEIVDPDAQMAKAVELAKEMTFVRTAGYGTTKLGHFSKKRLAEERKAVPKSLRDLKMRYQCVKKPD